MSPKTWFRLLGLSCLLIAAAFALPALTGGEKRGKKVALLIGVTSYDHSAFPALKYTENDVEKLAEVLRSKSAGFDAVRVLSHTRGKRNAKDRPTAANIRAALEELLAGKNRHDTILVALSGHGATVTVEDPQDKGRPKTHPFFCPADADLVGVSYSTGKSKTLINLDHLFDGLKACGAGVKLVLVDACRNEMKAQSATRNLDVATVTVPRNVAALFSCSEDERAWENAKLGHGVFFHFVLEGLKGGAKNRDGVVTWSRLSEYVRERVTKEVGTIVGDGARQTPHEVGNVRGASPVLARLDAKDDLPQRKDGDGAAKKDRDGGTKVVKGGKEKDEFTNSIDMKLKRIPKGTFTMGAGKGDTNGSSNEKPAHEVEITKDFHMGVYEVTQAQYRAVMGYNPGYYSLDGEESKKGTYFGSSQPGGGKDKVKHLTQKEVDSFPVENVSWEDAEEFCKKLSERAAEKGKGRVYRLPTEAEWEYACRAGDGKPYHGGDTLTKEDANFNGNLNLPRKVGSYRANKFGLHDMHGNVWEWCADSYDDGYYAKSPKADPLCLKESSTKVTRGGGWNSGAQDCRSARRDSDAQGSRNSFRGFRVVLVPAR